MAKQGQKEGETKPLKQSAVISSAFVGKKIPTKDGRWLKIMSYCDNYYMARFKGCIPFCCNKKELKARIEAHCL